MTDSTKLSLLSLTDCMAVDYAKAKSLCSSGYGEHFAATSRLKVEIIKKYGNLLLDILKDADIPCSGYKFD